METPENNELEKFIHQQLVKLPEREAPADLAASVMMAIAARRALPWWKQPFTAWPRSRQVMLFAALAAGFAGALWLAWQPAESLRAGVPGAIAERASAWAWIVRAVETLGNAAILIVRSLPWHWFVAIGVVLVMLYAACVATGVALWRIVAHPTPRRS